MSFFKRLRLGRTGELLNVRFNARVQPRHRDEHFGDPLKKHLTAVTAPAVVTGGGTMLSDQGEPVYSDVEVAVAPRHVEAVAASLVTFLDALGAPRGSEISGIGARDPLPFGTTDGLALRLNGTDLPDEVYEQNDVNVLIDDILAAIGDSGRMLSHWEGPVETVLYFYGPDAKEMMSRMASVVATHPLAQRSVLDALT